MSELKIAEVILRERRKLKLTQEELADVLSVSPQAVSNWERGGYPDITLLPRIANYFKITVDELIGNDEAGRNADMELLMSQYTHATPKERLDLAREYYKKYPSDYTVCECLAMAIMENKDCWEKDYPLLKAVCERIFSDCTIDHIRQNALECMSIVCPDDEWENWKYKNEQFYAACQNERIEERFWQRGKQAEYQRQNTANTLLSLMHVLGRGYMRYYDDDNAILFEEPQKTSALMKYRMRILESISEDGEIPEAWSGCYADLCLKAAGSLIGSGKLDEGFAYLERAFGLYDTWLKIPDGKKMAIGNSTLFGDVQISKIAQNSQVNIFFGEGTVVWVPYMWLFWQIKGDILHAMTNWPWFEKAKSDPRFEAFLVRAKEMAGLK